MAISRTCIKRQDDHIHIYPKDIFKKCYCIICCYNLHSSSLFFLQKSMNTYSFLASRIGSHLLPQENNNSYMAVAKRGLNLKVEVCRIKGVTLDNRQQPQRVYNGYRQYVVLRRLTRGLRTICNATKGLTCIVQVKQQLWKAYRPIGHHFDALKVL